MPAYAWVCQVCAASNTAGAEVCNRCAAPAELNFVDISRRRRGLGLDARLEPQPGPIRRQIAKCRVWLPGAYVVVVILAALQFFSCGGDMCATFIGLTLLPWIMVPAVFPFQIQEVIPGVGYLMGVLGFAINVAVLHFIGRGIDAAFGKSP